MGCSPDARVDYVTYTLTDKMQKIKSLMDSGWTDKSLAGYYSIAQHTVRRIRRLHERGVLDYYIQAVNTRYGQGKWANNAETPVIYDVIYAAVMRDGKACIGCAIPIDPEVLVVDMMRYAN